MLPDADITNDPEYGHNIPITAHELCKENDWKFSRISQLMLKKIAIAHPQIQLGGGSEARPLWLAEALKRKYQVDLITLGKINLENLNKAYGTNIQSDEINIISLSIPAPLRHRFDALRGYRLHRFCRKHSNEYAAMISTYNVMDFGKPGIQFIADFSFDNSIRDLFYRHTYRAKAAFYKKSLIRSIYMKFSFLLSGISRKGWMNNLTISNSKWSQAILKKNYGLDSIVIYPPLPDDIPESAWDKKKDDFVVMGRISPEKQVDRVISILKRIRNQGFHIRLHICGRIDDWHYGNHIKELVLENKDWITWHGLLVGKRKDDILSSCKYGMSACQYEAFGIATAEMIKSGAIVWVPNSGGQMEIVSHPMLIYHDDHDAVQKIIQIISNEKAQSDIRHHLKNQKILFSKDIFLSKSLHLIDIFSNTPPDTHFGHNQSNKKLARQLFRSSKKL
jgi:glycosyltransferase involved in cell wall biosynthesis